MPCWAIQSLFSHAQNDQQALWEAGFVVTSGCGELRFHQEDEIDVFK